MNNFETNAIINGYVDLTKIDKSKLGNERYLNVTVFVTNTTNEYGQNVSIVQSQSKEEREAGEKKNYVGNGSVAWISGEVVVAEKRERLDNSTQNAGRETVAVEDKSDLPF